MMSRSASKGTEKRFRIGSESGRRAFRSAPIGLALIGSEGRFLQVNPRLCRLLGYTEDQLLRTTLEALTDPGDLDLLRTRSRSLLSGEVDEFRLEQRFLRPDGRPAHGLIYATVAPGGGERSLACVIQVEEEAEHGLPEAPGALTFAVIRALTDARAADEVPRKILQNLGETGAWARGELWILDPQLKALRFLDAWPPPAADPAEIDAKTGMTILPGIGLVGRVWAAGKPIWLTDLGRDPTQSRVATAARSDLRSAIGFPILNGSQVTGVVALFSRELRQPDDGLLGMVADIGRQIGQVIERKRAEDALQKSMEDIQAVLDNVADGVMMTDEGGFIDSFNRSAQRLFGYRPGEVLGREAKLLMAEPYQGEFASYLASYVRPGRDPAATSRSREVWGRRKDGSTFPMEFRVSEMLLNGERRFVGILRDVSEQRAQREALEYQTLHDALTSLPNRTLLNDRLCQAIQIGHRERKPVVLLVMDMDGFKEVNDGLGHHVGDLLLQQVAQRLEGLLRGSDTVARLGGDEFAVVLGGETSPEGGSRAAKKILEALKQPFAIDDRTVNTSTSIGIAVYPEHGQDAPTLLRHADVAMYMAKRAKRGYVVYAPQQDDRMAAHIELAGELRHAIEHDELVLHFQPKIDLRIGRTIGVEALVRWQHPKRGLMPPDQFIPAAEKTKLIKPLTRWVLNRTLRQSRIWLDSGLEIDVAVNLSARNVLDPDLPATTKDLLDTWKVDPGRLEMDVTESCLMADPAIETLSHLGVMGVGLAIDDFGTSFSSLAQLKRLPVREIKIDRSFIAGMSGGDDVSVVRPIVDLGHTMGLRVVAEGVEDQETMDTLLALGCDSAQGFHVCPPTLATDLTVWLERSARRLAPGRRSGSPPVG
jgi:diguanylate cyclase (GGDEF)-like protein/PAS domain S-box-containing protein